MKTKEEILKMNKKELFKYKWSEDLKKSLNGNSNCSNCSDCSYCTNCLYSRNIKDGKYMICNIQVSKEEFEEKCKELQINLK